MNVKLASLDGKSEEFKAATPFPHIVTDDLFSPDFCRKFVKDMPPEGDNWKHHSTTTSEKWTTPLSDAQKEMRGVLMSSEMVSAIRTLTGIGDLTTKGGPKIIRVERDGYLHIHTDRGLLEDGTYRAVNMLIYLNEGWNPKWGGCLDICDTDGNPVKKIIPDMGRTIIFLNVMHAWHGHPRRLSSPEDRPRFAIQQYYFTKRSVGNESNTTYYFHEKPVLKKMNKKQSK